jgi:GxxExxY protein
MSLRSPISVVQVCNAIYKQLGTAHNECVYQKALVLELYNMGASSVESEKNLPVFFQDSKGIVHTIGTERVDVMFRYDGQIHLLELKATTTAIREHVEIQQLKKYNDALKYLNTHCDHMYVINFTQAPNRKEVDYVYFNHEFEDHTKLIALSSSSV